jgi:hypothetical protein
MKNVLELIENKLQALIEGSVNLLPINSPQGTTAISIIKNLREIVLSAIQEEKTLPNVYSVSVHPDIYKTLGVNSSWIDEILQTLEESASEYDQSFHGNITLEFFADPDLPDYDFKINSYTIVNEIEKTAVIKAQPEKQQQHFISDSYLILPNKDIFPLKKTITQIGRKNDNHLIIDNPTISRNHAQIRNINGNFMIFDLNSTSGTFVNGVRVHQTLLRSGDVISIANYPLVYGSNSDDDDLNHGSTAEIPRIVDKK